MRALLQRVAEASVEVDGERIAAIGDGLLIFLAIERGDVPAAAERLAQRAADYRIFPDARGRMGRSLSAHGGAALVVPQFTLAADTDRGRRPGFEPCAPPETARPLCEVFVRALRRCGPAVEEGRFGAAMKVRLVNEGPVTFLLNSS